MLDVRSFVPPALLTSPSPPRAQWENAPPCKADVYVDLRKELVRVRAHSTRKGRNGSVTVRPLPTPKVRITSVVVARGGRRVLRGGAAGPQGVVGWPPSCDPAPPPDRRPTPSARPTAPPGLLGGSRHRRFLGLVHRGRHQGKTPLHALAPVSGVMWLFGPGSDPARRQQRWHAPGRRASRFPAWVTWEL